MLVCGAPSNSADFLRVLDVEQNLFGGLSVPPETAQQIFNFRSDIYAAIIGPNNTVAAYSCAYPLMPKWAKAFIAGDLIEPELTPDMLLGRHESLEGASVYIGSVVVSDKYDKVTKLMLLAGLFSWRVKQLEAAAVSHLSVIMTPVTDEGERMIRYAGARQLNEGANRKDGYAVCGREFTVGHLSQAAAAVERYLNSALVKMNYNFLQGDNEPHNIPVLGKVLDREAARPWTSAVRQH